MTKLWHNCCCKLLLLLLLLLLWFLYIYEVLVLRGDQDADSVFQRRLKLVVSHSVCLHVAATHLHELQCCACSHLTPFRCLDECHLLQCNKQQQQTLCRLKYLRMRNLLQNYPKSLSHHILIQNKQRTLGPWPQKMMSVQWNSVPA